MQSKSLHKVMYSIAVFTYVRRKNLLTKKQGHKLTYYNKTKYNNRLQSTTFKMNKRKVLKWIIIWYSLTISQ